LMFAKDAIDWQVRGLEWMKSPLTHSCEFHDTKSKLCKLSLLDM
jgi:hypothetical protein